MQDKRPAVYILASGRNGTLCIGETSDVVKRAWEHRERVVQGFTARYGVHLWDEILGVIPARAGIQGSQGSSGFPPAPE